MKNMQYGTSEKAHEEVLDSIPVIGMGNIQKDWIVFKNLKYYPPDWDEINKFVLKPADVLFNRTNSAELVGKTAVYEGSYPKAVFSSYLIGILTKDLYEPKLLSFFINSLYGRSFTSTVVSQEVGQANLNGTKLSRMPIPIMSKYEQIELLGRIEQNISVIEKNNEIIENNLNIIGTLSKSILKFAFEGN